VNPAVILAASKFMAQMRLGAREAGILACVVEMEGEAQVRDLQATGLAKSAASVITILKNKGLVESVPNDRGWTTYRASRSCINRWNKVSSAVVATTTTERS
jgi:predicted deacylase